MTGAPIHREFWAFNNFGYVEGVEVDTTRDDGWHVGLPSAIEQLLWEQSTINAWNANTEGLVTRGRHAEDPFPDLPICAWGFVVSERTRLLVTRQAPGNAQFLPIHLMWKNRPLGLGPYWLMHILARPECFDLSKSEWYEERPGHREFDRYVIDAAHVPPEVQIFRPKEYPVVTLVRNELRCCLEDAGITGCGFLRAGGLPRGDE
jgi:hypothetical protein